jgi:uncharacterized membrane protein HdeD (DUF308 family)
MTKHFAPRLLLVMAITWILIGTWALTNDGNSYLPATRFAGVALLIDCLVLVVVSRTCDAGIKEKKWIFAVGAVSGLFSVLLLLDPGFTLFVFPFLVSPWIVSKGLLTMMASLALKRGNYSLGGDLIGGFLLVCCGLLIPHNPLDHPYGVSELVGAIGWTIGLLYVYDAYRLQKINPIFPKNPRGKTAA